LKEFIHNENCCIKKLPVEINMEMLKKPVNTAASVKEDDNICNTNAELLQNYEAMQIKLQNIIQENKNLKEKINCLQDDLTHIKSFGFHIMH